MLKRTSSPVAGPSPPVKGVAGGGAEWIPLTTVLRTEKLEFNRVAVALSVPALPLKAANSLSLGELTREGTFPEAEAESTGKT
jgi:hypothetical protein